MKIEVLKNFFYMTGSFTVAFSLQFLTMGLLFASDGTAPVKGMDKGLVYIALKAVSEGKSFEETERRTNSRFSLEKGEFVETTVTGTVSDENGEPLPGVTIS